MPRIIFFLVIVLVPLGCGTELAVDPDLARSAGELIARGWEQFEKGSYREAAEEFTKAHDRATSTTERAEALNGRGWSNAYLRDLPAARNDYTLALNIAGIPAGARNDVRAGLAFVAFAQGDYNVARSQANLVTSFSPPYQFAHDARVTQRRLRLLSAQSAFALGLFNSAAVELDLFDPASAPHAADPVSLLYAIQKALNSL
jgi:Flp pilus assembly protein TadD